MSSPSSDSSLFPFSHRFYGLKNIAEKPFIKVDRTELGKQMRLSLTNVEARDWALIASKRFLRFPSASTGASNADCSSSNELLFRVQQLQHTSSSSQKIKEFNHIKRMVTEISTTW